MALYPPAKRESPWLKRTSIEAPSGPVSRRHCSADWETGVAAETSDAHNTKDKRLLFDLTDIANLRRESEVADLLPNGDPATDVPFVNAFHVTGFVDEEGCQPPDCPVRCNGMMATGVINLERRK